VRHVCRLQDPNGDVLVRHARLIGDADGHALDPATAARFSRARPGLNPIVAPAFTRVLLSPAYSLAAPGTVAAATGKSEPSLSLSSVVPAV
jgi:hypothetical protein